MAPNIFAPLLSLPLCHVIAERRFATDKMVVCRHCRGFNAVSFGGPDSDSISFVVGEEKSEISLIVLRAKRQLENTRQMYLRRWSCWEIISGCIY